MADNEYGVDLLGVSLPSEQDLAAQTEGKVSIGGGRGLHELMNVCILRDTRLFDW